MQTTQPSRLALLLIEDEVDLAQQFKRFLVKRGFSVSVSHDLNHSLALLSDQVFDGVLFDRLLPDGDALESIEKIKHAHDGLLLIMSALGQVKERVLAFRHDVDYYLPKPVDMDELLAILEHYERSRLSSERLLKTEEQEASVTSAWRLHFSMLIAPNGQEVQLTTREALMVGLLLKRMDDIVTRSELILAMNKRPENYDPKALDSAMYRIRQKIEEHDSLPVPFETVHGLGYVWRV